MEKTLRWQDVIEIGPLTPQTDRVQIEKALERLQSTNKGQQMLRDLRDLEPDPQFWPNRKPQEPWAGLPADELAKAQEFNAQLLRLKLSVRNTTQVTITTLPEIAQTAKSPFNVIQKFVAEEASGGLASPDLVLLDLPTLKQSQLSMVEHATQRRFIGAGELDDLIVHELQHVLDYRLTERAPASKAQFPRTNPCGEERAVRAQNAYEAEINAPNRRYTYEDIRLSWQLNPPDMSPGVVVKRLNEALIAAENGLGCAVSENDLMLRDGPPNATRRGIINQAMEWVLEQPHTREAANALAKYAQDDLQYVPPILTQELKAPPTPPSGAASAPHVPPR